MIEAIQKLKRLGSMPPREWAHRLREKGNSELERIGLGVSGWEPAKGIPFKQYLAEAPAQRFYFNDPERLRQLAQESFPHWIDSAVDEAEKLCRHEFALLGYGTVHLDGPIDWHRDPVTGRSWERRFWTDYRLENDAAGRDSKIIHELNRHQHLPRLAKAFVFTGDERYASEAVAQLESWIEQNPPGLGINWHSSLEIGIRATSWLWTLFLLLPSRSLTESSAERIGKSLFAHLEHVYRYTSIFSSPNTHVIGEAAALLIAGLVFRDQKRPAAWLERGAALLAEQSDKQILDDGVHGELSSAYHCYALDFYLQALALAERNRFSLPDRVRQKIGGMLHFLMHLRRPDGTLPMLGDDDGGRALALVSRDYRSFNDALCVGAVLFRREDFKHEAGAFFEEAALLLGAEAWPVYRSLSAEPPAHTQAFFRSAGYWIQRSGWGSLDSHLIFDCGGLGILNGGHAHADALSVVLFGRGQELLVDPGTFVYNSAPEWRDYFRSTHAHNTVTIDHRDQARRGGTFRWSTRIATRVEGELSTPAAAYIEAEHEGYERMPQGVTHRRRLLCILSEYWIVVDDFRGVGEHTFDFNYHLATDVEVSCFEHAGASLEVRADKSGLLLSLFASGPLRANLIRGQEAPIGGWVSRGYGEKKPGSTLLATLTGPTSAAAMTVLGATTPLPVVRRLKAGDHSAIVCSCENDGFEDFAIYSTGESEIEVENFRMRGEFFWLRTKDGTLQQKVTVRARSLTLDGKNILEDPLCVESPAS